MKLRRIPLLSYDQLALRCHRWGADKTADEENVQPTSHPLPPKEGISTHSSTTVGAQEGPRKS